ncbi:MAG: hypothetical protein ACI8PT_004948 [Gammaproteobacteria bacterium]|jgi:hypothetical protein
MQATGSDVEEETVKVGRYDTLPDVRDGLTRVQRVVLYEISRTSAETGRANVPTAMLYGRVLEHIDMSVDELQAVLRSLGVADGNHRGMVPAKTPIPDGVVSLPDVNDPLLDSDR